MSMAQNLSEGYDTGQHSQHQSAEIEHAIKNYRIIVEHVNDIDTDKRREMKRRLLVAIIDHVNKLEESLSNTNRHISDENKKRILIEIHELKDLSSRSLLCDDQSQSYEWDQSPLVLFLSLASDVGKFSTSDPRTNGKQSSDLSATGQDWGQLSDFFAYLRQLKFHKYQTVENGKPKGSYWPGLPTCVMALIPLETLYQNDSKIMISASADRFAYNETANLDTLNKRDQRLANLESECIGFRKKQMESVKWYSEEMKTEYDLRQEKIEKLEKSLKHTKHEGNQAKLEAFEMLKKAKKLQKENTTSQQEEQDLAEAVETAAQKKKAADDKAKEDENGIQKKIKTLEEENPPDASEARVPVYLPVIISTWHPDGTYLPTCFLDCRRFRFIRPLGAEKEESLYKSKKREVVYPATSCAEWDGFVNWTAQCCLKEKAETVKPELLAQS